MIRTATVTQVYPGAEVCDLVFDSGLRMARVPIMSGAMSSDGGFWGTPAAQKPATEGAAGSLSTSGRNICAVVGMVARGAVVLGFFRPAGSVMSFTEDNRAIYRHPASGGYCTFAPDGSLEAYHASGAYLRIGTGAHQDLASVTNGNWDVPTAPSPTITLHHPAFSLVVDPEGNATMTYTTLTLNGNVQLNGALHATGDGVFNNVSVDNHDHDVNDVATGGATITTTAPLPGS